jgi:hypothetical protein
MKEVAVQLGRLDWAMIRKSYNHCLTHALEDLALKDI